MKVFISIIIFFISISVIFTQNTDFDVVESEYEFKKRIVNSNFYQINNDFVLCYRDNISIRAPKMLSFFNSELEHQGDLELPSLGGKEKFISYVKVGEKLGYIYESKENKGSEFCIYINTIDCKSRKIEDKRKLVTLPMKSKRDRWNISFKQTKNNLLINASKENRDNGNRLLHISSFDSNLNKLIAKEVHLPMKYSKSKILDYTYLDSNFILLIGNKTDLNLFLIDKKSIDETFVYKDKEDMYLHKAFLVLCNNKLFVTSGYSENAHKGIKGVFFFDVENKKLYSKQLPELSKELIKSKENPEINNLKLKQVTSIDGNIYLTGEIDYTEQLFQSNGNSQTIFHNNEVVLYSYDDSSKNINANVIIKRLTIEPYMAMSSTWIYDMKDRYIRHMVFDENGFNCLVKTKEVKKHNMQYGVYHYKFNKQNSLEKNFLTDEYIPEKNFWTYTEDGALVILTQKKDNRNSLVKIKW